MLQILLRFNDGLEYKTVGDSLGIMNGHMKTEHVCSGSLIRPDKS